MWSLQIMTLCKVVFDAVLIEYPAAEKDVQPFYKKENQNRLYLTVVIGFTMSFL